MSSFEINKILAAVLLALIVAWVSGLLASKLIEPKTPAHNAVTVATARVTSARQVEAAFDAQTPPPVPLPC